MALWLSPSLQDEIGLKREKGQSENMGALKERRKIYFFFGQQQQTGKIESKQLSMQCVEKEDERKRRSGLHFSLDLLLVCTHMTTR